jgi:hypothetical protein
MAKSNVLLWTEYVPVMGERSNIQIFDGKCPLGRLRKRWMKLA